MKTTNTTVSTNNNEVIGGSNMGTKNGTIVLGKSTVTVKNGETEDFILLKTIRNATTTNERNKAIVSLWDKYQSTIKLAKKYLINLAKEHTKSSIEDALSTYECDAYEFFKKALDSVDIKRCEHLKSHWTFYLVFYSYLGCMNRGILRHHMNKIQHETSEWTSNSDNEEVSIFDSQKTAARMENDGEESAFKNMESSIIQKALSRTFSKFTQLQKDIWKERANGLSKAEVTEKLGLTIKEFNASFRAMKKLVKSEIDTVAKEEKFGEIKVFKD